MFSPWTDPLWKEEGCNWWTMKKPGPGTLSTLLGEATGCKHRITFFRTGPRTLKTLLGKVAGCIYLSDLVVFLLGSYHRAQMEEF